jgi:hypothetical protein
MQLLGTWSENFDVTESIFVTHFEFVHYFREGEYTRTVIYPFLGLREAYDSVRWGGLYSFPVEFCVARRD